MDSVAKRTRNGWDVFYRDGYEKKKKREKDQQSGDCVKSGEKNIEYIGSCLNSRNVAGEKLDLKKLDVGDDVLDDLEQMNDEGVCVEYIGSCLNSRNVVGEKLDLKKKENLDVREMHYDDDVSVEYIGTFLSSRNVVGEKLDLKKKENLDVREVHYDDVSVDLEQMDDKGVSVEYIGSCLDSRNVVGEKKKLDVREMHDDDVSVVDLEKMNGDDVSVDLDDNVDLKKMNGDDVCIDLDNCSESSSSEDHGTSHCNRDKFITIDENEFLSIRNSERSHNKKDDEAVDDAKSNSTKKESKYDEKRNDKFDGKVKKSRGEVEVELIKILVDSINAQNDQQFSFDKNAPTHILPLRFRFGDEAEPLPEKSKWDEYVDSLFQELELGLRQIEVDSSASCEKENCNESPAGCCGQGEHLCVLDEEIGIVCKNCHDIILDIKYVLPDFYVRPWNRRAWREPDGSPSSTTCPVQFPGLDGRAPESHTRARGTVWDLVPGIERGMFPHQREGFEFIWRNLAGDIFIDNLKKDASSTRGCVISHAPGTGKSRLTIAFLQTFMKQYPDCCPVIIAPKGMLLNWESELVKWNFNVPFHNLNKKELSGKENEVAVSIFKGVGGGMSMEASRMLKMYSWTKDGGVLGVSYTLFVKLTRERHVDGKINEMLLHWPGLLVLDEGHTPRNEQSLIWKALTRVSTKRRIILSGTPFQNNMVELFNTLSLVNPEFVKQIGCEDHFVRKRWMSLTRCVGKTRDDGLRNLRGMLDPFVHVHKGTILDDHLPGLRHTVVFLHPTECQKALLEEASSKEKNVFRRIRLVSMVSVHPSLKAATESHEDDVDAGVKMKFLLKLVWLADALGERVLIFSQFLDPLAFIMKQIECHLSWREGREVLYMDGQLDEKQRQDSISSFNDGKSEAKVLLASQRACSEGINLVGASRVVLLDTVWNPSMEKQATSRAYRLGQTKIVHVYRLFTSGVEVRQFAQQIKKVQISELIFSAGNLQPCKAKKNSSSEDKVLEAMLNLEGFNAIFEKIIYQPDESHLIDIFGLEGQK